MKKYFSSTEHGSLLLELLIAIVIMTPIMLVLLGSVRSSQTALQSAKTTRDKYLLGERLNLSLISAIRQFDAQPFKLLPRIHSKGRITFPDGSLNLITNHHGTLRPDATSSALSAISLNMWQAQRVLSATASGPAASLYVCPAYNQAARLDRESKYFIGITADGFLPIAGTPQPHSGRKDCSDLTVTPAPNMVVAAGGNIHPAFIRMVIPIDETYTIYLDRSGILRHLGHAGATNPENQPLLTNVASLFFSISTGSYGELRLNAQASRPNRKSVSADAQSVFNHREILNVLLNEEQS